MSISILLIILGVLIFLFGFLAHGSSQSEGFSLKNIGINIGGTQTQNNKVGNIAPQSEKKPGLDWSKIVTMTIGLATAIVGYLSK